MSDATPLKEYISGKLLELEKEKDLQEAIMKGKVSFGLNSEVFGHLPAWPALLQKKKKLRRLIWIDSFFLSFFIIGITSGVWERLQENWVRALVSWVLISAMVMLLYVTTAFFSFFTRVRSAEQEARKLIYQDILERLEREERK